MFLRAFLLTLCVVTGHMETMGWPSICWRPKLGGNCSCHFQGHPTLWGYWWRVYSTWQRGYTASWWIRMPYRFRWILWRLCLPRFPWRMLGLVVKEQHSLCGIGHRRARLWWVQRYSPHALSHCCGMCSLSSHSFPFFLLCITSHDDIQMEYLCQAGPTAGALINPPHLSWSVYTYSPNDFAREHVVGRNKNVMGYPFPMGT